MSRNDGGPAFPVSDQGTHGTFGMSLRDWFAGQALAGMFAADTADSVILTEEKTVFAYAAADAMLAERDK